MVAPGAPVPFWEHEQFAGGGDGDVQVNESHAEVEVAATSTAVAAAAIDIAEQWGGILDQKGLSRVPPHWPAQ